MRFGEGKNVFDVTDADQASLLERTCRHLLTSRTRAFAQGFITAVEGGEASREWLEIYQEKRNGRIGDLSRVR